MQENNAVRQAFPDEEPTNELRRQAKSATQDRYRHHRTRSRFLRTAVGAVVTGALVLAGAVAGPPAYAYYKFQRIAGSVDDCQTAIFTRYTVDEKGAITPAGKVYYSRGNWRIEDPGLKRVSVYLDGTLWIYHPSAKTVFKKHRPEGPFGYNPTGFSLRAMLADYSRWNWLDDVSIGTKTVDGKTVEVLTVTDNAWSRTEYLADPETHMPFRATSQYKHDGIWEDNDVQTFEFNTAIDPNEFSTSFPPDVKVVDQDAIKRDWAAKLETPIATLKTPTQKIEIRDIAVNERGHIFLVFTDGETDVRRARGGHILPTWIATDSLGNRYYTSILFQPYMKDSASGKDWIVLSDSQVPQGVWLIPEKKAPWTPRKLTFSCTIRASGEKTSNWSTSFAKPTTPLIPEWSIACAMAPHTKETLLREEEQLRRNKGMMTSRMP
jgi:outer membrane lipoprotein-sorting protein